MEILTSISIYDIPTLKLMQASVYKDYVRSIEELKSRTNGDVVIPFDNKWNSRSKRKNSKEYYFHSINSMIATINNIEEKNKVLDYLSTDVGKEWKERLENERKSLSEKISRCLKDEKDLITTVLSEFMGVDCVVTSLSDDLYGKISYISIKVCDRIVNCMCDSYIGEDKWEISLYSTRIKMNDTNRHDMSVFCQFISKLIDEWETVLKMVYDSVSEILKEKSDTLSRLDKVCEELRHPKVA